MSADNGMQGKLHTMTPEVADLLKRMGLESTFQRLRQLDDASALVEEGKLKREVYEDLVASVEKSLEKEQALAKHRKPKEKSVFTELLRSLRPVKDEETARALDLGATIADNEKPVIEDYLQKRTSSSSSKVFSSFSSGKAWKRRYCVLYQRALLVYRSKGDRNPKSTVILGPEFFVQVVSGSGSGASDGKSDSAGLGGLGGLDEEDEESLTEEFQRRKGEPEHAFVLSDLTIKFLFACNTEEEMMYWVRVFTSVLRKIIDEEDSFDTPQLMNVPARDPAQIQADMTQRKANYVRSLSQRKLTLERTKRRSWFKKTGKTGLSEAEWDAEERKCDQDGG